MRAPTSSAPIIAAQPPVACTTVEPAKSRNPRWASQPPPHIQCPKIGYTSAVITRLYTQYAANFVRPAIAPDTIVAAVAANASWNMKNVAGLRLNANGSATSARKKCFVPIQSLPPAPNISPNPTAKNATAPIAKSMRFFMRMFATSRARVSPAST
ncbi:MAG: hypothetical protein KatS3mg010_1679 [Acidimicrobiia bacterium]|nr:MAG: hypothetical protein KatS3mg010_1679 [Acidimicrobiia bacterium]